MKIELSKQEINTILDAIQGEYVPADKLDKVIEKLQPEKAKVGYIYCDTHSEHFPAFEKFLKENHITWMSGNYYDGLAYQEDQESGDTVLAVDPKGIGWADEDWCLERRYEEFKG